MFFFQAEVLLKVEKIARGAGVHKELAEAGPPMALSGVAGKSTIHLKTPAGHTLWWTNIAMENHNFKWENPIFPWPFSIAMLVHQRVTRWKPAISWCMEFLLFFGGEELYRNVLLGESDTFTRFEG